MFVFTRCVIIVFDYLFFNFLGDSLGLALLSGGLYILTNIWLLTYIPGVIWRIQQWTIGNMIYMTT